MLLITENLKMAVTIKELAMKERLSLYEILIVASIEDSKSAKMLKKTDYIVRRYNFVDGRELYSLISVIIYFLYILILTI